jgi:hypothetical protein
MLSHLSPHGTVRAVGILLVVIGLCAAVLVWTAGPQDPDVRARATAAGAGPAILGIAVWALSTARERRLRDLPASDPR